MEKVFELIKTGEFAQEKFPQTIRESFVKCGLTPSNAVGEATRFCQFNPAKPSGCTKFVPSSAGKVDYTTNLPAAAQQQMQVGAQVNDYFAGNFDEDDDDEGMNDGFQ